MSGQISSSEGGRADDGPVTEPEAPTAETAVLSTSHGDAEIPPRPSRAARLRDGESATEAEPATAAEAPANGATAEPAPADAEPVAAEPTGPKRPGLRRRAALRRRVGALETRRDDLLRDLGGLVFELARLRRERPDLVQRKTAEVGEVETELEAIHAELGGDRPASTAPGHGLRGECPSCGALFGAADAYCSACGTDLRGTA